MYMGIKKFVAELNRMNRGKVEFAVVEQYYNAFCIVGARPGDRVTFNYPSDFYWDGDAFQRHNNDSGYTECYHLYRS